jgi:hypothetical protein
LHLDIFDQPGENYFSNKLLNAHPVKLLNGKPAVPAINGGAAGFV